MNIVENIYQPITIFLVTVLISTIIKYYFDNRRYFLLGSKLPGPGGWPILGNALEFLSCNYDILPKIMEYHKTYDLFALWVGHQLNVFVKSPQDAEIYCNSYKLLNRGKKAKLFYSLMGKGLLLAEGPEWKKAKKVMEPAFPYSTLKRFVSITQNQAKILMHQLEKVEGERTFLINSYLNTCVFDIIDNVAFELNFKDQKHHELIDITEDLLYLCVKRAFTPWNYSDFIYKFFEDGKSYIKKVGIARNYFDEYYQNKRKQLEEERIKEEDKEKKEESHRLFWKKLFENEDLNLEEITHHVLTTMFVAFDTSASTMCFVLTMLGLYPDVQEKTYDELITIINEGEFDEEKLPRLEYLERVIKETLRLFPTVPMNIRQSTEDIQFDKHLIPAGSEVLLNIMALHRNSEQFSNPNEFNPDNFLPENVKKRHPYSFIPFSMGPRKCIGTKIAMRTIKIVVGTILMKYKVECDYKKLDEIPICNKLILKMTNKCPVRLLKRPIIIKINK